MIAVITSENTLKSVHRLRTLMEQAPGFVAVGRGPDFVFELANKAYYQLVGNREILGKTVRKALPELEDQDILEFLDQVYKTGKPFIGRAMPIQLRTHPNKPLVTRYVDFIYQPIFEKDNSVSGIFVQGHDVTEAHELSKQLNHQAAHDSLTGLLNRREFERQLEIAIGEFSENDAVHSLLHLDLDQFSLVNDTCGHQAGDEYLRVISMILISHIKSTDTFSRLGGDEFSLLLKNCPAQTAIRIAEDLRQAVKDVEFIWCNRVFGGSVSIGLVSFGDRTTTAAEILSAADSACFLAKEKGRNRVQVYCHEDDELIARWQQMDWVGRLRSAIKEDRIKLYAQKIQPLKEIKSAFDRYEVLMRLKDSDERIVPPMAFIPAAERYGLMPTIDRYIIEKVFAFLSSEKNRNDIPLCLSINLSGATLNDGTFSRYLQTLIDEKNIDPEKICFEITETTAVANLTRTADVIQELRQLGFSFALDDFGSGMSSFGYLKNLPVDYIKIDGIFIKHVLSDKVDAAMVEAIVKIATVMGIQTVAEFVENEKISNFLSTIGVDLGQGHGIHKPEPLGVLKR